MESIEFLNALVLLGGMLVLAGIFSSLIASRFGVPLLLLFVVIGMLAGEDGLGGIEFSDFEATYLVGSVALAIILFDGGLRTRFDAFRAVLWPSLLLATFGVVLTSAAVGAIAYAVLPLGIVECLLLGAIVASTDAAAVFFLLRTGGLQLKRRVGLTLEIESGTNDPVAVFVTVILVELVLLGGQPSWGLAGMVVQQVIIGGAVGVGAGLALSWLINRIELPQGLHPLLVATAAVTVFAVTAVAEGSGFLAVYLTGLMVGNRPLRASSSVVSFHDALTWLCQIVMFVLLGLLVTPHRLLDYLAPALVVAFGLMLVARPLVVTVCLRPLGFSWGETAFVGWVGLRGAVGIFLASIPVLAHLPDAQIFFNVAFFVVLVSLLLQGSTVGLAAQWFGVALPQQVLPTHRTEIDLPGQLEQEMVGYPVVEDSPILRHVVVPTWARLVLIIRNDQILSPSDAGSLRLGDYAYFLAPPSRAPQLDRLFTHAADRSEQDIEFYGEFVLNGEARLGDIETLYGVAIPHDGPDGTVAEMFASSFHRHPMIGDSLSFGDIVLVVHEVEDGRVLNVGMRLGNARAGEGEDGAAAPRPHPINALRQRLGGVFRPGR